MANLLKFLIAVISVLQMNAGFANDEAAPARKINVDVSVAAELMPDDAEQWILYVYAARPDTRLPLSNYKGKLSELPKQVTLTESMYLLPHLTLKQAEEVVVIAKATKSKNPHQKSAEDLIGYSAKLSFASGAAQTARVEIKGADQGATK